MSRAKNGGITPKTSNDNIQILRFDSLKAYQRAHRETFLDNLGLRIHRALSWLNRAEQCGEDYDARFIFLWIAFNAAYANDPGRVLTLTESRKYALFLKKISAIDDGNEIYNLVWGRYPQSIWLLLENKYVFQPFWDYQNGESRARDWDERFKRHRAAATRALGKMDTPRLLSIIFTSLYTLRTTYPRRCYLEWRRESAAGRTGQQYHGRFEPVLIGIMMRHPNELWGEPCYPVAKVSVHRPAAKLFNLVSAALSRLLIPVIHK